MGARAPVLVLVLVLCGAPGGAPDPGPGPATKRNAFVSFATGYKLGALRAVMRPFMHFTQPTDDVVLFVSAATKAEFAERVANNTVGVQRPGSVILLTEDAFLKKFTGNDDFVKARFGWLAPWHKRMMAIRNWMSTVPGKYHKLLICDARDIAFQRNPFEDPMAPRTLFVFGETQLYRDDFGGPKGHPHRAWHLNQKWVRNCYGEEFLQRIWNDYSTCAGVVFGDEAAIQMYVDTFTREFMKKRLCSKEGSDTAVHVKVITDLMPEACAALPDGSRCRVDIINYTHAPILHMGPIPMKNVWDLHARLLNADGKPYSIVHQVDRNPVYFKRSLSKWGCAPAGKAITCNGVWTAPEHKHLPPAIVTSMDTRSAGAA